MKKYKLKDGISFEDFVISTVTSGLNDEITRRDYETFKELDPFVFKVGNVTGCIELHSDGYMYNVSSDCFEEYIDESVKPKATGDYIGDHFDGDALPPSPVHKSTKRVENGIIADERSTLCTEARGQVHNVVTLIDDEVTCPDCLKIMEEGVRVGTSSDLEKYLKMQEGKEAYQKLITAKEPELPSSYHKKVWSTYNKCYVYVDCYDMVDALDLPNFETIQTFKKLYDAGNRSGGKSLLQDLTEARNQLDMAIERLERKENERLYEEKHNG